MRIQTCQLLTAACRETDSVIRWGGEEFMVLARNLSRPDLGALCERIRQAVEGHEFRVGSEAPLHLTCSAGAAVFPFLPDFPEACDWERVLEIADTCLYAAKRSGRNAWVWVVSTDRACPETLPPDLPRRIEDLAQAGLLKGHSSLPPGTAIRWPN